jgi:hypothetical protein
VALIEINWTPSERELRTFGLVCLVGFGLIGSIVAWRSGAFGAGPFDWHRPWALPIVLWTAGAALAITGAVRPRLLRRVYVTWMTLTYPIGWTVSQMLLAVAYFGVFSGVAGIFRILGYDPLERRLDRQAKTYWVRRQTRSDVRSYFRQF